MSNAMTQHQSSTKLDRRSTPSDEMKLTITKCQRAFEKILPKHVPVQRFLKIAHTAIMKEPKLAQCDPRSVIIALLQCAELGLEPNSPQQYCHIIPYQIRDREGHTRLEAQFQFGYRGLLHLAYQSGQVSSVNVQTVHENDHFVVQFGDDPKIEHTIDVRAPRGEVVAAYMVVKLKDGSIARELMSKDDIDQVRSKASEKSPAWRDHYDEMARKSVFKRGAKWLPKATERDLMTRAIELDNASESGVDAKDMIDVDVISEIPSEVSGAEATTPNKSDELKAKLQSKRTAKPTEGVVVVQQADGPKATPTHSDLKILDSLLYEIQHLDAKAAEVWPSSVSDRWSLLSEADQARVMAAFDERVAELHPSNSHGSSK